MNARRLTIAFSFESRSLSLSLSLLFTNIAGAVYSAARCDDAVGHGVAVAR